MKFARLTCFHPSGCVSVVSSFVVAFCTPSETGLTSQSVAFSFRRHRVAAQAPTVFWWSSGKFGLPNCFQFVLFSIPYLHSCNCGTFSSTSFFLILVDDGRNPPMRSETCGYRISHRQMSISAVPKFPPPRNSCNSCSLYILADLTLSNRVPRQACINRPSWCS